MYERLIEADDSRILVEHEERGSGAVRANLTLQSLGLAVRDMCRAQFTVTLDHAGHDGLISAALRSKSLFASVFVLLLAAHERGVSFEDLSQRCRERLRNGIKGGSDVGKPT